MNVLVYIPALYYCEYGFYLEVIQRHLEKGDSVKILRCNRIFSPICKIAEKACFFNGINTSCDHCEAVFNEMIDFLKFDSKDIIYTEFTLKHGQIMEEICSQTDLYNINYKNYDVGMTVVNTIACGLAVHKPDINYFYNVIYELSNISMSFYDFSIELLQKIDIDKVYFFNGRIAINRSMLRACQALHIEAASLEYAFQRDRFVEYANTYPQDYNYLAHVGKHLWGSGGSEKHKVGRKFFGALEADSLGYGFHEFMHKGRLPYSYHHDKKSIVIFNSTLIEIVALPEFIHPLIPNFDSTLVVAALAKMMQRYTDYHIYLRVHPNMSKEPQCQQLEELKILKALSLPNLTIVWPEDETDSYSLLHVADKVVTFGSTMGVEATLYGKPSILIGKANYAWADVVYTPQTFSAAIDLLLSENLPAKPVQNAEKFGYVMHEFGTKFEFYNPLTKSFLGRKLHPEPKLPFLGLLKKKLIQKIQNVSKVTCKNELSCLKRQLTTVLMEQRFAWYNSPVAPDCVEKFDSLVDEYIEKNLS